MTELEPTATERLRALLDERGVEYKTDDRQIVRYTDWGCWFFAEPLGAEPNTLGAQCELVCMPVTPEQAVAATLGPAYEPPIAAHWDGDVLVLTTPRDPSSIHVQRAEGQPRKVYPSEATLGPGTCEDMYTDDDEWFACSECNAELRVHEPFGVICSIRYCPNCGRKVVECDSK